MRFFTTGSKGDTFIEEYKKSGKCPPLFSNYVGDMNSIDVESQSLDSGNGYKNSYVLNSYAEMLRNGNNDWEDRDDFFKDDGGNTTVKEDLVCSYDMVFDMYNIKTPVEFRTMYHPTNGTKSYSVLVNKSSQVLTSLNVDLLLDLGLGGGGAYVSVSATELGKIFGNDTCIDRTKIFHYYHWGKGIYVITTNQLEASENGADGRHDNGDGSNDGNAGGNTGSVENPNLNFDDSNITCEAILGNNLVKVIKAAFVLVRIGVSIATIVIGMLTFFPALTKGDAGTLNSAIKKCVWLAVLLMIIILLPVLLRAIGNLFSWDLCGIV